MSDEIDPISDERLAELRRLRAAGSLLPEDVLGLLARLERAERNLGDWSREQGRRREEALSDLFHAKAELALRDQRIAELERTIVELEATKDANALLEEIQRNKKRIAELEAAAKAREAKLAEMWQRIKALDEPGATVWVAQVLAMMQGYDFPREAP